MPITVHSPHDGLPVKIRDQDVGRAVKDRGGQFFYVVPRADGSGFYGSRTRVGNPREEVHYDQMVAKTEQARETGAALSQQQVHDARGKPRPILSLRLIIVLIALILVGAAILALQMGYLDQLLGTQAPTQNPTPTAPTLPDPTVPTLPTPTSRLESSTWRGEAEAQAWGREWIVVLAISN